MFLLFTSGIHTKDTCTHYLVKNDIQISNVTFDSLPPNKVSSSPYGIDLWSSVILVQSCEALTAVVCCGTIHPLPKWFVHGNREEWPPIWCSDLFKDPNICLPNTRKKTADEWSERVIRGFTHVVCSGSATECYIVSVPRFERK